MRTYESHQQERQFKLFDVQKLTLRNTNVMEAEDVQSIVPVVYPCVRVQSDVMVTADIYTQNIYEINVSARPSVKVISRLPSTIDEVSDSEGLVEGGENTNEHIGSEFEDEDSQLYDQTVESTV